MQLKFSPTAQTVRTVDPTILDLWVCRSADDDFASIQGVMFNRDQKALELTNRTRVEAGLPPVGGKAGA